MITIFTPTFNRGYIISKLYDSLVSQTYKDFEWLIVDDGSTDNTKTIVEKFILDDKIKIRYFYQQNQGKHIAFNLGVSKCVGDLFYCVDSDDYLPTNSLEIINNLYQEIKDNNKAAGIIGHKYYYNQEKIVGIKFPTTNILMNYIDLYYKYKIKGDKAIIFKSSVIKKYHFPKFNNEKFLTEAYLYQQIDEDYCFYITDSNLYYSEYLTDGLSSNFNKIAKNYPIGFYHYYQALSQNKHLNLKYKLIFKAYFYLYTIYCHKKIKNIFYFLFVSPLILYLHYLMKQDD